MNDVRALCDAPRVPGLIDFVGAYHDPENGQVSDLSPESTGAGSFVSFGTSNRLLWYKKSKLVLLQIAIVLEYMDGGSLADILQKVSPFALYLYKQQKLFADCIKAIRSAQHSCLHSSLACIACAAHAAAAKPTVLCFQLLAPKAET